MGGRLYNHPWLLKNSDFRKSAQFWGQKMLGDPRKSFVGHPDALRFLAISRKRVFQQPYPNTLTCPSFIPCQIPMFTGSSYNSRR
jgi:hypothetical protein